MDLDLGLLLTLPLESVAVRVVLASAVAVVLARALLRVGIRSIGARIAIALVPTTALVAVAVISSGADLQLPRLLVPAEAVGALPIPVTDGYVHFAQTALPLLVTVWGGVVAWRLGRRVVGHVAARRRAREVLVADVDRPATLVALVARLAGRLRIHPPTIALSETCAGGAYVVGTRRPVVVLGRDLVARLDAEELEGVIAHELAHVRRRDNLVATAVGVVRDLAFFVPGSRWAVGQLHRERERAADQVAVRATGRPGALASGLLKTLEGPSPAEPCAALAPSGSLVERVQDLVDDRPPVSRVRRGTELSAVAGTALLAVVVAVAVPSALTGAERERDAVAVVWTTGARGVTEATVPTSDARAFDVYRRTRFEVEGEPRPVTATRLDEGSLADRQSTWRACADPATCPSAEERGLGLVPRPVITLDDELPWQATPAFGASPEADRSLRLPTVYWLQRVN